MKQRIILDFEGTLVFRTHTYGIRNLQDTEIFPRPHCRIGNEIVWVRPHLITFLDILQARFGSNLYLFTTSCKSMVYQILAQLNIRHYFRKVFGCEHSLSSIVQDEYGKNKLILLKSIQSIRKYFHDDDLLYILDDHPESVVGGEYDITISVKPFKISYKIRDMIYKEIDQADPTEMVPNDSELMDVLHEK